jgi:hypothetical protein
MWRVSGRYGWIRVIRAMGICILFPLFVQGAEVTATRIRENPLLTVNSSSSIGDNLNGPSVIRVPGWVQRPLGRYYMYFAHHKGQFIRLAYANSLRGPWKVYEPGVLKVEETAFYRPQPDPQNSPPGVYTHVASPEIYVDHARKRIVMWFHGMWTEGQKWPEDPAEARKWLRERGYFQYTQVAESADGIHYKPLPGITRQTYLRVFSKGGEYYGIARLGQLLRSKDVLSPFELGPDPFRDGPYAGRVRHVAFLERGNNLEVFFSAIGDAPESIIHTTIPLNGDWTQWKAVHYREVLHPEASYECPNMEIAPSEVGEIYGPARQLRDPAIFVENAKTYLFYTICGEQGVAAAEIRLR